jgi:protein-tyrosine phosphatase
MTKPFGVLFVCLGNICRSPMADGVFAHKVKQAGLDQQIRVDSAGTAGYHTGEKAHHGTLKVLSEHHIPYDGRARQFKHDDDQKFRYILAMDRSNFVNILAVLGIREHSDKTHIITPDGVEIALFLHYAHQAGTTTQLEVPDPYYTGRFDEVYQLIDAGCDALLDYIIKRSDS